MTAAVQRPSRGRTLALAVLLLAALAGFVALGVWQLERRTWKLDLIARTNVRLHASPTPAPGPAAWPTIDAAHDAYRRVRARGVFLNDRETLVQAVTDLGGGFWLMTPLRTDEGFTVLVNRGFVPPERRDPGSRAAGQIAGETTVDGLLRISEPHGGFLRANAPEQGRWYSRDVTAIAREQHLGSTAPYFVDADARPNAGGWPVGGLTVVRFPNSHLVYALTWFGMAALSAGALAWLVREPRPRP